MKVALNLQAPELEKLPAPLLEKLTVPAGVILAPPSLSLTVAVHVVEAFSATEEGEQEAPVEVLRLVTPMVVEPLLIACMEFPL
jgi:hypothetical protein